MVLHIPTLQFKSSPVRSSSFLLLRKTRIMAQQRCEVAIPGSASPGQSFTAITPDGQQMVVEVPPGADPGSNVIFLFTPKESVGNQPVAATVVSQSDVEQPVSHTPRESLGNQPVEATVVSQSDVQQPVSGGAPELDASSR